MERHGREKTVDDEVRGVDPNEVAESAFRRYEERGGTHGDDQADWYEAEREIRERGGTGARKEPGAGA